MRRGHKGRALLQSDIMGSQSVARTMECAHSGRMCTGYASRVCACYVSTSLAQHHSNNMCVQVPTTRTLSSLATLTPRPSRTLSRSTSSPGAWHPLSQQRHPACLPALCRLAAARPRERCTLSTCRAPLRPQLRWRNPAFASRPLTVPPWTF